MGFKRPAIWDVGVPQKGKPGDGWLAPVKLITGTVDADSVIPVQALSAGVLRRSNMTSNRTDAFPSRDQILDIYPDIDIGDSFVVLISNGSPSVLTLTAGANNTIGGQLTVSGSAYRFYYIERTNTGFTITGL